MAGTEKEIEIRSLDGESTRVSIATNQTVAKLKILLKESFVPAKFFPNFHLFFKGAKMGTECQIDLYPIEHHDFIVFVPFTKKNSWPTHCEPSSDQSTPPMKDFHQSTSPSFADSAWSDIMSDLSCMSATTQNDVQPKLDSANINNSQQRNSITGENSNTRSLNTKRNSGSVPDVTKRPVGDFLHDIVGSYSMHGLDDQSFGRLSQALDSVYCLSDLQTDDCLLFKEFRTDEKKQCLCPFWLKKILKSFSFLNIFSGLLQMHRKDVTWNHLKGALKQLKGYGVEEINIVDVEHLSVLCPKVVMFGNDKREVTKLGNIIVVVDSSEDKCKTTTDQRTARKPLPSTTIINAIRKRKKAFEADLWGAIKSSMGKTKSGSNIPPSFSLKNLLKYMEVSSGTSGSSESKRARTNTSKDSSFHSGQTRCRETDLLLPMEMIEHLQRGIGSHGQILHVEKIDARMAVYAELPEELSEITRTVLKGIGISRLYSHQAESIQASLSGKNVVVATSTSSGKSLCYNLPVLEALFKNLSSCSLYLFPTKALAQDQLRALLEMTCGLDVGLNIGVYDGDTSQEDRAWLRDNARLLITNPDMLHVSILPFHRQFRRILSNLRFVIIDEAHAYKGAFGCHTALILRRLRRICCHVYGSDPSFVFCTATSANPREHAMELANIHNLELIQNDGSPCAPKLFLLWNPPLCHKNEPKTPSSRTSADPDVIARRSSPILEASCLFAEMVQHGLRCIAFCKTRKLSELVLCYTREILQETAPLLVDSICAYRAGYTAQDRRRIESDFFCGKLRGVAATNALELGIDVGHIDSTIHLGFPGSVASLWQQAGRSGRRERPSMAVYVAFGGPLDQYFMKYPEKLFRSPVECCQVDAQNQQVLEQHIACASFEQPLSSTYDEKYFGSGLNNAIQALMNKGNLTCDPSRDSMAKIWSYIGHEEKPSHAISIRAIETEKYKVIDKIRNELLEEIEESKAFFQVYEGAVYMHQGKTYLIKILDLSMKIAFCQEADLKYYTKTRDYTDIYVIGGNLAYPAKVSGIQHLKTTAQANTCKVTTNWFGFYRIWRGSNQIFDSVDLSLPSFSYQSQAVWIRVPQAVKRAVEVQNFSFRASLHAASHALLNVVPLYIMCNSSDLGTECVNPHDTRYVPERVLLYDQHPGGLGISAQVQPLFRELLNAALELVLTCHCTSDAGCPSCVQTLSCREYNEVLDKNAALMILKGVIEAEKAHFAKDQEH